MPDPTARLAWLFDVDGTLLSTEGAARQAFACAVHDTFGVTDDLQDISFGGRIEPLILADILHKHHRSLSLEEEARFWDLVFGHMRRLLRPGRGRVMSGVPALLDAVAAEPGWISGLLTGNMTQMARIKLGQLGLDGRFAFGGYGEMAPDRDALARTLVRRLGRDYGVPPRRCIVVGDTEHDIACARAADARVIAVATGTTPITTLAQCAPDLLLEDLGDTAGVVAFGHGVAAGE